MLAGGSSCIVRKAACARPVSHAGREQSSRGVASPLCGTLLDLRRSSTVGRALLAGGSSCSVRKATCARPVSQADREQSSGCVASPLCGALFARRRSSTVGRALRARGLSCHVRKAACALPVSQGSWTSPRLAAKRRRGRRRWRTQPAMLLPSNWKHSPSDAGHRSFSARRMPCMRVASSSSMYLPLEPIQWPRLRALVRHGHTSRGRQFAQAREAPQSTIQSPCIPPALSFALCTMALATGAVSGGRPAMSSPSFHGESVVAKLSGAMGGAKSTTSLLLQSSLTPTRNVRGLLWGSPCSPALSVRACTQ